MSKATPRIIESGNIALGVTLQTTGQAVGILIEGLGDGVDETRKKQLASMVMAREEEASTFIGKETALPHARTSLVSKLVLSACVAKEPFAWDESGNKVRLIFLMAVPKTAIEEYLQTVKTLTHVFRKPGAVEKLCASTDSKAFVCNLEEEIAATSTQSKA